MDRLPRLGSHLRRSGLDPLYSWIGTPDRHLGWLTWVVFGLVFLVGQNLGRPEGGAGAGGDLGHAGLGIYGLLELADLSPVDLVRRVGPGRRPVRIALHIWERRVCCSCRSPAQWPPTAAEKQAVALDRRGVPARWRGGGRWRARPGRRGSAVAAAAVSRRRCGGRGVRSRGGCWRSVVRSWFLSPRRSVPELPMCFRGDVQRGSDEWRMGVGVISDHPLLGVGPEGYRLAFPSVVDAEYERRYTRRATPDRAHNGALDTAAMFGLPGLVAYIGGQPSSWSDGRGERSRAANLC